MLPKFHLLLNSFARYSTLGAASSIWPQNCPQTNFVSNYWLLWNCLRISIGSITIGGVAPQVLMFIENDPACWSLVASVAKKTGLQLWRRKKVFRKKYIEEEKKNSSIFPTHPPPIAPNRRNVESCCTLQKQFQPFSAKPILLTNILFFFFSFLFTLVAKPMHFWLNQMKKL